MKCPIDGTEFKDEFVQLKDGKICTQCAAQVGMIYGSSLTEAESEKHSLAEVKTLMSTNSKVTTQDEIDFQKNEVKHRRVPTHNQKSQQSRSSKSAIWGTVSLVVIILVGGIIVKTSSGHDTKQAISSSTSSLTPSEKLASIKDAESISRAKKVTESNKQKKQKKVESKKNTTKPSNASRYKSISLNKFTDNPIKYDGVNIKTSGIVTYIQKNPDDKNIYYVVITPRDKYTSSGYSDGHGSVTEVNIDTMHDTPVHEGDYITVKGGGLSGTVQLNGKTLKSDIVVDSLTVH